MACPYYNKNHQSVHIMKLSTIFTVVASVLGHTMTNQFTSEYLRPHFSLKNSNFSLKLQFSFKYSNFQFKGTENVNSLQSLRMLKIKLKLCQPTVCNKCKKIVYENYSRKHVKRCKRVLELEDCCDLTKYYNDSFFG